MPGGRRGAVFSSEHYLLGLCLLLDVLGEPLEELGVLPLVDGTQY